METKELMIKRNKDGRFQHLMEILPEIPSNVILHTIPSSRPINPIPSFVFALIETRSSGRDNAEERDSFIAGI